MPSVMAQLSPRVFICEQPLGHLEFGVWLACPRHLTYDVRSPSELDPPKLEEITAGIDDYGDSVVALEVRPALTFDY